MTVVPRFRGSVLDRRHWVPVVAMALGALVACAGGSPAERYTDRLLADRAAKDRMFREGPDSPLLPADRASFQHLAYFPIDEAYRVPASLQVVPQDAANTIKMPTSTGQMRDMVRIGYLEFVLKGQPLKLTAFAEVGTPLDRLFVPFADRTGGTETYAGGRYLDLDRTATGLYDLDFNRAYHPYCLYNPKYDCPYPPPENRLPLPVRAGERIPQ